MTQRIFFNHIQARSFVDGPGERTVLFLQGCPIHCPGCQNVHLWDFAAGTETDVETLAITLSELSHKSGNVTISGGEPFAQSEALAYLVRLLRFYGVSNIIVYTGYTWELLNSGVTSSWLWVQSVLDNVDIVVDGPFVAAKDDDLITWRGSRNQRPIDVAASRLAKKVVTLSWDNPEIVITAEGDMVFPVGLADTLAGAGVVMDTRMCGQTE